MKGETTVQYLQNDMKVCNVSLEIVNKILKLCPVCEERSTIKTKRQRQSQTPIVITSSHFGHRGQLDLVDMGSCADPAGYKYLFHYQVSVLQALTSLVFWQDHFYKISVLAPLKSKSAAEVARVFVTNVVACYGAPIILQTDNGKEFTGTAFVDAVELLCGCKVIRGRPRHPQTQGSVETANKIVKSLIGCVGTSACVVRPGSRQTRVQQTRVHMNTCLSNTCSCERVCVNLAITCEHLV